MYEYVYKRQSQSNPYMIARLFHFASLSDCYWLKEAGENLTWDQVSLFRNPDVYKRQPVEYSGDYIYE